MPLRLDIGTLKKPRRNADGRLIVDAYISRSGVFVYRNADGSERREYRPPAEVFKADSMASFAFVPVTNDHPSEPLDAGNATQHAVGAIGGSPRRDGKHLAAALVVYEAATVADIEAGKVETSSGYEVDLDETPGVSPEGERYDVIQRNIRGNHVAIVARGRAGRSVRIRMDEAVQQPQPRSDAKDLPMDELKKALLAQVNAEARADAAEAALTVEKSRADTAEAERDAEKVRADKAEGERDAEKVRADTASTGDRFDSAVRGRVELERAADPVINAGREDDKRVDVSAMSDREIKLAVVKRVDSEDVPEGKSDDYVDARYDSAVKRADVKPENVAPTGERNDAAAKRAEYIERQRAASQPQA